MHTNMFACPFFGCSCFQHILQEERNAKYRPEFLYGKGRLSYSESPVDFICMYAFICSDNKELSIIFMYNFKVFCINGGKINLVHIFIPVVFGAVVL